MAKAKPEREEFTWDDDHGDMFCNEGKGHRGHEVRMEATADESSVYFECPICGKKTSKRIEEFEEWKKRREEKAAISVAEPAAGKENRDVSVA